MKLYRLALTFWIGASLALWGAAAEAVLRPVLQDQAQVPFSRITEDDPRWDCTTMGNRVCGTNPEAWYAAGEWVGIGARRD